MKKRVFIERKSGFDIEKHELQKNIFHNFGLKLESLRYLVVYDLFNLTSGVFTQTLNDILLEKNRDSYLVEFPKYKNMIAYEFLPGQFDQRADSAEQCIKLLSPESQPIVKSGTVVIFDELVKDSRSSRKKSRYS